MKKLIIPLPVSMLLSLILFFAWATSSCALEPYSTGTQSDEELKRPAEDRDWEVGDIAVTATIHAEKGWTYFNQKKDIQSALKHFEAAIKLWPDTAQAILGKAYCLEALGKEDEALRSLSECKCRNQISPDVVSLAEIEILTKLKRYPEALRVCDRIAKGALGVPGGYRCQTFSDLIPRTTVLLAMGDKDGAIRAANQLYLFGICDNPYAKKEAIKLLERCGASPPSTVSDTSVAKAQVQSTLRNLISDASWADQKRLEKVVDHKLTFSSANGNDFYWIDDDSDSLFSSVSLVTKNARDAPSLSIGLNYIKSLVTFEDLKKWFPNLLFHPASSSGCLVTGGYSDFSEGGNRIVFEGGNKEPPHIVTNFTIVRELPNP